MNIKYSLNRKQKKNNTRHVSKFYNKNVTKSAIFSCYSRMFLALRCAFGCISAVHFQRKNDVSKRIITYSLL